MAAIRRRGSTNGLWNAANVASLANSTAVSLGRNIEQLTFYVSVVSLGGAASVDVTVQVAHSGDPTLEGLPPDADQPPARDFQNDATLWYDLYYLNGAPAIGTISFAAIGRKALIVPDIVSNWWRLKRTDAGAGNAVITAGWEAGGGD